MHDKDFRHYLKYLDQPSPFDITYGICRECQQEVKIDPEHLPAGQPDKCEDHLPLSAFVGGES